MSPLGTRSVHGCLPLPRAAFCSIILTLLSVLFASSAAAAERWYQTDLHTHSSYSGDAGIDLPMLRKSAMENGFDAIFVSDHALGMGFPIFAMSSVSLGLDGEKAIKTKWWPWLTYGSPTATSTPNELVATPAKGLASARLQVTAGPSPAEVMYSSLRGPGLRATGITMSFSVYPLTAPGSGAGPYVSISLGGDPTAAPPLGFSTADDVPHPGRSWVIVWQCGTPRSAVTTGEQRVIVHSLAGCTAGQWNDYTIDVSTALLAIPAAERPHPENALRDIKLAVRAAPTTSAEAFFDDFRVTATAESAKSEFEYRETRLKAMSGSSFGMYPAAEVGVSQHVTATTLKPDQALQATVNGVDAIPAMHAQGAAAILAHPGSAGGVDAGPAIATRGYGADMIETRQPWYLTIWDGILNQGHPLTVGVYTAEKHLGYDDKVAVNHVWSDSIEAPELLHRTWEGRVYGARNYITASLRLAPVTSAAKPHPTRYPLYVSPADDSLPVTLQQGGAFPAGYRILWCWNDGTARPTQTLANETPSSTMTRMLPMTTGTFRFVRVDVVEADESVRPNPCDTTDIVEARKAATSALMVIDQPGLPAGMRFGVDELTTPSNLGYTVDAMRGIVAASFQKTRLSISLENRASTLAELHVDLAGRTPQLGPHRRRFRHPCGQRGRLRAEHGQLVVRRRGPVEGEGPALGERFNEPHGGRRRLPARTGRSPRPRRCSSAPMAPCRSLAR